MEEVQEMRGDRLLDTFDVDALTISMEAIPVEEHGREGGEQAVGDVLLLAEVLLGLEATERGAAGAQHIHGVRVAGQQLERGLQRGRQAAHPVETPHVGSELALGWQMAIEQEIRDL